MQVILLDQVVALFGSLHDKELAKAIRTVELLEEFGNDLGMPHSRHLSDGLLELRIRGARELRIMYCFSDGKIYLLHSFIKKTQKTAAKELARARTAKDALR